MKKQTEEHDWLGDCAESYIAYLCTQADFEVFAGSKWGADLAIRDKLNNHWFRIEVKSTNTKKSLSRFKRDAKNQLKKAELFVLVRLSDNKLESEFYKLSKGEIIPEKIKNPTPSELIEFILKK